MSLLPQTQNKFLSGALAALLPACLVSLLLFYLMQYLVSGNVSPFTGSSDYSTLDFVRIKRDEQSEAYQRRLPKQPETVSPPSTPEVETRSTISGKPEAPALSIDMPAISGLKLGSGPFLGGMLELSSDGDIVPIVRVEPRYPRKAARAGTEGWVKLEFTILEDGSVSDARVIDAKPRRVFNREAVRAIQRWKFKPKLVDGKAVTQTATQVINFKLEK